MLVSYTSVKLGVGALLRGAQSHLVRTLANEWASNEPDEKYIQDTRITKPSVYQLLL